MDDRKIEFSEKDWDEIFKIETIKIGKRNISIKPLTLSEISEVGVYIGNAINYVTKNIPDFGEEESKMSLVQKIIGYIPVFSEIIIEDFPEIVSQMSNIKIEDIKRLPSAIQLDLAVKCLDVNLEGLESLSKNLFALIDKATVLSQGLTTVMDKKG